LLKTAAMHGSRPRAPSALAAKPNRRKRRQGPGKIGETLDDTRFILNMSTYSDHLLKQTTEIDVAPDAEALVPKVRKESFATTMGSVRFKATTNWQDQRRRVNNSQARGVTTVSVIDWLSI
jgi:hypothetical protein